MALKGFVSRIALLASWLGLFAAPAAARDFAAFNADYGANVVAPAFKALAGETGRLVQAADAFAAAPSRDGFANLRVSFELVSDAWMAAEFYHLGPLGSEQRADRFEYWPEKRPIIDKQLNALIANPSDDALEPRRFAQASVAVQGLPALERMLYGDAARQILSAGPEQKARIAVIRAIAHNLDALAKELANAWDQALGDPRTAAAPFAPDPNEAAAQLYADLVSGIQIARAQKLAGPRGQALETAKPKAAEQWRSGRSLRDIKLNLGALNAAVLGPHGFATLLGSDQAPLKQELAQAFDAAMAATDAVPEPMDQQVADPEGRRTLGALLAAVTQVSYLLQQKMAPALGISIGFNELDGDGS